MAQKKHTFAQTKNNTIHLKCIMKSNFKYRHYTFTYVIFFIITFFASKSFGQDHCKEVIGYYPGWQWYDRDKLVNPETIDYSKYTIINYAFLYPLEDGTITITDPWGDKNLLLGSINWALAPVGYDSEFDLGNPAYHHPNTSLIHYAHLNNVPVMISIGGWTLSNDFPAIAANTVKRSNFAHSCNELVRTYNIDGIDIDWEYPGFTDHGGTPDDIYNYTLLLQEIRDSLDVVEDEISKNLMLTAAFGAAPDKMDDIEWDQMIEILDYINLMSYDFFGAFSSETNHNSPLYTPESGDPTFNCNSAIERLVNDYSVPSEMINLGVAFYGRSAKTIGTPILHGETTGESDIITFAMDEGTPLYYNILQKMDLFNTDWDALAEVPYLLGKDDLYTFLSYDDEKSIGIKGQYIVDQELAGAIIWEITGDYIETTPGSGIIALTPLADTLKLSLCHAPTEEGSDETYGISEQQLSSAINIYPNPVHTHLNIQVENGLKINSIQVTTLDGKQAINLNNPPASINLSALESGVYIIRINTSKGVINQKFIKKQ